MSKEEPIKRQMSAKQARALFEKEGNIPGIRVVGDDSKARVELEKENAIIDAISIKPEPGKNLSKSQVEVIADEVKKYSELKDRPQNLNNFKEALNASLEYRNSALFSTQNSEIDNHLAQIRVQELADKFLQDVSALQKSVQNKNASVEQIKEKEKEIKANAKSLASQIKGLSEKEFETFAAKPRNQGILATKLHSLGQKSIAQQLIKKKKSKSVRKRIGTYMKETNFREAAKKAMSSALESAKNLPGKARKALNRGTSRGKDR